MMESMSSLGTRIAFVGVDDLEIAADFYGGKLGLRLRDESPFALVSEHEGSMLRITRVDAVSAAPYTVLGWSVDDIRSSVAELAAMGVGFQQYDVLEQDASGIWTAPNGDQVAWFHDPFDNNLSLTQFAA